MSNTCIPNRSVDEWESQLGNQIREIRIRKQMNQEDLAKNANVSLSAVRSLETGKGSSLATLIKVVRALEKVDWLEAFAPAISISPIQLLKAGGKKPRQRYYVRTETES